VSDVAERDDARPRRLHGGGLEDEHGGLGVLGAQTQSERVPRVVRQDGEVCRDVGRRRRRDRGRGCSESELEGVKKTEVEGTGQMDEGGDGQSKVLGFDRISPNFGEIRPFR
jgi:hypothetical protein